MADISASINREAISPQITSGTNGGSRHRHQQSSAEYHTSEIPTTSGIAVDFYGDSDSDYSDYSDCVGKTIESRPPSKR